MLIPAIPSYFDLSHIRIYGQHPSDVAIYDRLYSNSMAFFAIPSAFSP